MGSLKASAMSIMSFVIVPTPSGVPIVQPPLSMPRANTSPSLDQPVRLVNELQTNSLLALCVGMMNNTSVVTSQPIIDTAHNIMVIFGKCL